ncbi:hypothetical protein D3C73_1372050 [compost metagenome]
MFDFLSHASGIHSSFVHRSAEHVLHYRMRLGYDANFPAGSDETGDDVRADVRLAAARRSLDGQIGVVQVLHCSCDGINVPIRSGVDRGQSRQRAKLWWLPAHQIQGTVPGPQR